jgi:hypothetical protein
MAAGQADRKVAIGGSLIDAIGLPNIIKRLSK